MPALQYQGVTFGPNMGIHMTDEQELHLRTTLKNLSLSPTLSPSPIRKTDFTSAMQRQMPCDGPMVMIEEPIEWMLASIGESSVVDRELQRRGVRFLPKQALKRALRVQSLIESMTHNLRHSVRVEGSAST